MIVFSVCVEKYVCILNIIVILYQVFDNVEILIFTLSTINSNQLMRLVNLYFFSSFHTSVTEAFFSSSLHNIILNHVHLIYFTKHTVIVFFLFYVSHGHTQLHFFYLTINHLLKIFL